MPRLELWMTVFAGVAGGLAGVLWSGLVTAVWLPKLRAVIAALRDLADKHRDAAMLARTHGH